MRFSVFFASMVLLRMSLLVPSASAQRAWALSWQVGMSITMGEVLSFNRDNWQAVQSETQTVDGRQLPNGPALWMDLGPCSGSGEGGSGSPRSAFHRCASQQAATKLLTLPPSRRRAERSPLRSI
jgi:hypothetical protein